MPTIDLPGVALEAVFDHAAVAGDRLRDLIPLYADLLGGKLIHASDNLRMGYRAIQLRFADGTRIELMEPLSGSTFFRRFFASGGSRLHHVTFKVADFEKTVGAMEAAGYTPVGVYTEFDSWKELFLHPREANGVLVQLAQVEPGYPLPVEASATLQDVLAGQLPTQNGEPSP